MSYQSPPKPKAHRRITDQVKVEYVFGEYCLGSGQIIVKINGGPEVTRHMVDGHVRVGDGFVAKVGGLDRDGEEG